MFFKSSKTKPFFGILCALLLCQLAINAQENGTPQSETAVTLLDSTRERDGLSGSVRRVKVQSAKLEMKGGRPVEGPLQLLEITTYSVNGERIENISYPLPTTAVGKEEYKYDDKGHIVEMTLRGDDGSILSREKYNYELDAFGNWTKMVTSLIVFEDGQLKVEPVEVTYRTLAYYFNDTVAQIVEPDARAVPTTPKGVAISNAVAETRSNQPRVTDRAVAPVDAARNNPDAARNNSTDTTSSETFVGARRVGKKAVGSTDEAAPVENASNTATKSPMPVVKSEIPPVSSNTGNRKVDTKSASPTADAKTADSKTTSPTTDAKPSTPAVSAEMKAAFEHYKAGRERFDSGFVNDAIEAYEKAIKLEPNSAEVHLSLGHAYIKLKEHQKALKSFKRATDLNPDMAEAFYGLGLTNFNLRRHKDAAKAFKQATVVNPNLAKAHYGLALAYQEIGEENGVITEYRILQTLDRTLAKKLADTFPDFNLPCRVPPFCK
ncbi:MAG TPA: tetratricopeptide repeat protein [Pyrinomonadaceae bacterium]|nr:tetratricopeptide repeat protein [Pyrinomonadaceae bacterium]